MRQLKDFLAKINRILADKWWILVLLLVFFLLGTAWVLLVGEPQASGPESDIAYPALSGSANSQIIATEAALAAPAAPEQTPRSLWANTSLLLAILGVILVGSLGGLIYVLSQSVGLGRLKGPNKSARPAQMAMTPSAGDATPYLTLLKQPEKQFVIHALPFSIGRSAENELVINESFDEWQSVSRVHARIGQQQLGQESYYVIEDLASQNGTRVEGRLTPKNLLQDGMRIWVGKVTFVFHMGEVA
ncbi:MAG: FHA domain-containing protein [Chloroflexota bacterium]